jgi:riboflavin synthase
MFTGLIEAVGCVVGSRTSAAGRRLTIDAGPVAEGIAPGASVCVDGACLTVAHVSGTQLEFDAVRETLERTTIGGLRPGDRVNLERSLRADGRFEGHFVQGHVQGTAVIRRKLSSHGAHVVWFESPADLLPGIVPKGAIAVDGISLTVAELNDAQFSVALIPTTLQRTTLWAKPVGARANVETDILARTVVHWLHGIKVHAEAPGLTLAVLQEHGFA